MLNPRLGLNLHTADIHADTMGRPDTLGTENACDARIVHRGFFTSRSRSRCIQNDLPIKGAVFEMRGKRVDHHPSLGRGSIGHNFHVETRSPQSMIPSKRA